MANETKKFLDLTGLTRYDENIKNHIAVITGNLSDLDATNKSSLVGSINEVGSIAKGATVAFSVTSYSELISTFSSLPKTTYKVGQTVYVVTLDVPDLWISAISDTSSTYTYTTDAQVISDIEAGTFKVGYYTFSKMETQKVNLSGYVTESTLETEVEGVEDKIEEVELITSSSLNELNNKTSENEELFARTIIDIENRQEESERVLSAAISDLGDKTESLEKGKADKSDIIDLGKEYLKENIVGGINTLTQEMLGSGNTIYSITYDYVCYSDITVPTGCTLEFNGGSITGGNITLQNTKLEGDVKFSGTTISGSCSNDIFTPQMFGAYPSLGENENNKTQHTLGFQNLVRVVDNPGTATNVIYLSSGHYSINAEINFKSSCKFYGNGDSSIIDIYDGSGSLVFGEISTEILECTITSDANKMDTKIVVDDTSELSEGDYIIITDAKDGSFHSQRAYYRTSEVIKIKTISGNNVYFESSLYGDYFVDYGTGETTTISPAPQHRTVISKFTPKYYNLSEFKILSHSHNNVNPSKYYSFVVKGIYNCVFNNITVENYGNSVAGSITLGLNFNMDHCTFRSYTTYTGDAYGLSIDSCQNFVVKNSTFRANSHALKTGETGTYYSIINRNFLYENIYLETSEKFNADPEAEYDLIDLDVHESAEYYKFLNINAPYTTCDTGGYNVTVEGCRFYNISPTFNAGDFSIKKCEVFGAQPNFLMSNTGSQNSNGHNSLTIEDCILHQFIRIDLQDSNYTHKPYDYFIFKNNIFMRGLEIKRGSINYLSLENNVFTSENFVIASSSPIRANNISIKNNNFQSGSIFLGFDHIVAEGVISNNTIIEKENSTGLPDTGHLLGVYYFKGNITSNVIISYKDNTKSPNGTLTNNVELICVGHYSDVQIYDNILRKTTHDIRQGVVKCSEKASVIFDRNIHNSVRHNPVNVTIYGSGNSQALSNYYQYINIYSGSELSKNVAGTRDNLGKTFFVNNINKLLYIGAKKGGYRATYLEFNYNGNGQTAIKNNNLTYGKSYVAVTSNSGDYEFYLYFSKYNTSDERFNRDELLCVAGMMIVNRLYVFTAPDPTEYPYIYGETTSTISHAMNIIPNNWICEMDGCAYNVKRTGTTSERPSAFDIVDGFKYFDTTLGKEIFAVEVDFDRVVTYWRESDGAIAGTKRFGTTSERPTGIYNPMPNYPTMSRPNIYVGFKYFDTDLGKEIYASAIAADGTVTWTEMTSAPSAPEIPEQVYYIS